MRCGIEGIDGGYQLEPPPKDDPITDRSRPEAAFDQKGKQSLNVVVARHCHRSTLLTFENEP